MNTHTEEQFHAATAAVQDLVGDYVDEITFADLVNAVIARA